MKPSMGTIAAGLVCVLSCSKSPEEAPARQGGSAPAAADARADDDGTDAATTKSTELHEADLEAAAVAVIAQALEGIGLEARVEGSEVRVGAHVVSLDATIENRRAEGGAVMFGVAFEPSFDGEAVPALVCGVIGIGEDADDAREDLIAEWGAQHGAPLAFAFAARELPDQLRPPVEGDDFAPFYAPVEMGGVQVFSSPAGLRWESSEDETLTSDAFAALVAEAIEPALPPGPGYHGMRVLVIVEGAKVDTEGCRVDGVDSPQLAEAVAGLDWPEGAPAYMYKQYFVFSRPSK